jgi:hypothetical protein
MSCTDISLYVSDSTSIVAIETIDRYLKISVVNLLFEVSVIPGTSLLSSEKSWPCAPSSNVSYSCVVIYT